VRVLITGAGGFVGKNLVVRLQELEAFEPIAFGRGDDVDGLREQVRRVDAIVHLAGVNRPADEAMFSAANAELTCLLCEMIRAEGREVPFLFASSIQAECDNPYGRSKRAGERHVTALADEGNPTIIYRLPNIFGKWCRPNYNSVVATFCHNIATGLPIRIDDPDAEVRLVYIDDVVSEFVTALRETAKGLEWRSIEPEYATTVGTIAERIRAFARSRETLVSEPVGVGFDRALYATFISYLPTDSFAYGLPKHADPRGVFVEVLKTRDTGQFSYFTAGPGVTRGGHYHHTKTEKFLVLRGNARFRFRNIQTDEHVELHASGDCPMIVETIPGWSHDITNVGTEEMVVMLWANEIFDRERPDTVASRVA